MTMGTTTPTVRRAANPSTRMGLRLLRGDDSAVAHGHRLVFPDA
jgi:hypothetical protein